MTEQKTVYEYLGMYDILRFIYFYTPINKRQTVKCNAVENFYEKISTY